MSFNQMMYSESPGPFRIALCCPFCLVLHASIHGLDCPRHILTVWSQQKRNYRSNLFGCPLALHGSFRLRRCSSDHVRRGVIVQLPSFLHQRSEYGARRYCVHSDFSMAVFFGSGPSQTNDTMLTGTVEVMCEYLNFVWLEGSGELRTHMHRISRSLNR